MFKSQGLQCQWWCQCTVHFGTETVDVASPQRAQGAEHILSP